MKLVFFETPLFTRLLPKYLDDQEYRVLLVSLTGKSSDLRVIYYHLAADHQIWFFTLYDNDEATDLSSEEKKQLKQAIQMELAARRAKR